MASKQIPRLHRSLGFVFLLSQNSCSRPQVPGPEFKATAVQWRGGVSKTQGNCLWVLLPTQGGTQLSPPSHPLPPLLPSPHLTEVADTHPLCLAGARRAPEEGALGEVWAAPPAVRLQEELFFCLRFLRLNRIFPGERQEWEFLLSSVLRAGRLLRAGLSKTGLCVLWGCRLLSATWTIEACARVRLGSSLRAHVSVARCWSRAELAAPAPSAPPRRLTLSAPRPSPPCPAVFSEVIALPRCRREAVGAACRSGCEAAPLPPAASR